MRKITARFSIILAALAFLAFLAAFPFLWQLWIDSRSHPLTFSVETAPTSRVAIVFGARVLPDGRLSSMLRDRVDTAVELYKQGKVQKLLLSGDHSTLHYNEPDAMVAYAVARGVPLADIQPDYAGLRTYDTCYRAQAIFGVESALLVTQEFHLPRALFTCNALGLQAQGVVADQRVYHPRALAWSEMREIPATLVALMDVVRRKLPTVLGEPIPLVIRHW